jgi:hypothetical protein
MTDVEPRKGGCLKTAAIIGGAIVALVLFFAVSLYNSVFPYIPRYASPVSPAADAGAIRIEVPYCAPNPGHCVGYLAFFRDGRVLLYLDPEGVIAFDPATGAELWRINGQFNTVSSRPYLTEFDDGAYLYAEFSGQIIDLDDGRLAFEGPMFETSFSHLPRYRPRRLRGGVYRVPFSRSTFLIDLETGRVAPYAAPEVGVETSGVLPPEFIDSTAPGWHGPLDQTDDGDLALWFLVGEENFVTLQSRSRRREVWRAAVPGAPHSGWIDRDHGVVVAGVYGLEDVVAFDLDNGRPAAAPPPDAAERPLSARLRAADIIYEHRGAEPDGWRDLESDATDDLSIVAHYQMQRPRGGFRTRGSYFGGSGTEGGARRLYVTSGPVGRVLLERPMESERTTTAGYDVAIAVAPDGARVAVLPTDGVVRVYHVPPAE